MPEEPLGDFTVGFRGAFHSFEFTPPKELAPPQPIGLTIAK